MPRGVRLSRITSHPRSIAARIQNGNVPTNKGIRRPGWHAGRMRDGWFKRGHKNENNPHFERPIGTLRMNEDGYLERKIRNDLRGAQRWRTEHALIWEKENGSVPQGHIVVFQRTAIKRTSLCKIWNASRRPRTCGATRSTCGGPRKSGKRSTD